eukprot:3848752-Amphidinium_carterae.1
MIGVVDLVRGEIYCHYGIFVCTRRRKAKRMEKASYQLMKFQLFCGIRFVCKDMPRTTFS